jgi:TrmH family RNA methyltransferase
MKKAGNMQLKNIRRLLKEKKVRDFENIFVAEGEKIVRDIFIKGHMMDSVFVSKSFAADEENKKFILNLEKRRISVFEARDDVFDKTSSLQNSQGVLAVIKKPESPKCELPVHEDVFSVLCDGIQDPGNLGSIIRTSAAIGADSVLLAGDCVDTFNPKVVRASSGTVLDIPLVKCGPEEIDRLKEQGCRLLVSQVAGEEGAGDISEIRQVPRRCILAFGSEGRGVSKEIADRADQFFYIPTSEKVESLNVTTAVAIALYAVRCALNAGKKEA